jgi:hypothetical protein
VRLIVSTVVIALVVGVLAGGTLRDFPAFRVRWPWIALIGVVLQFLVIRGALAFPVLLASFACLLFFAGANVRVPGFALILVGLSLNVLVISANQGMPVTQHALTASNQAAAISDLTTNTDGQKHFLADEGTLLLPLGDVIAIGNPIRQAVSVGDIFVHLGIAWFIVLALRKPREAPLLPEPSKG